MAELWIPSSADIDSRLVDRFSLGPDVQVNNPYWLIRTIQPVTNADELKQYPDILTQTRDISAGGGGYTSYFLVPSGKRYRLLSLRRNVTTANSQVAISDPDGHRIQITSASTSGERVDFTNGHVLDEGWNIEMQDTGNGADTSRSMQIWIIEEDSF